MPCDAIIDKLKKFLKFGDVYLCLNRHYLNIDNQNIEVEIPNDYLLSITAWLKKSLEKFKVVDLSKNYRDYGDHFTWVIPDRIYFISK